MTEASSGLIDTDRFPIHASESEAYERLVAEARAALDEQGMFNLDGFLQPEALQEILSEISPVLDTDGFAHARRHNIYFGSADDLPPEHPALTTESTTSNLTLAADVVGERLAELYEYPPLARFLADAMGKPELYAMEDPLARINVMRYQAGEGLGWHFDRSEFTTTLLLQAPTGGAVFAYRTGLRSPDDPNYAGVIRLLNGEDPDVQELDLAAGTLNIFRGKNTAHRVTPVEGTRDRIIAVFSYFEQLGVMFSDEEKMGFYGRTG